MNLTLGMRILLHLTAYDPGRDGFDLPPEVTQQGIAAALSVRQSDVSRALARLRSDGHIDERSSTIGPGSPGRKQRLKVYSLSGKGREMALRLSSKLLETEVVIPPRNEGETARRLPLKEVNSYFGTSYPLLRLADMVAPDGTVIMAPAAPPAAPAPRPPEAPGPEPFFVGRSGELRQVLEKVRQGPEVLLSVVGIPGAGKTALAQKLVSEMKDRRPFYFLVREWPSYGRLLRSLRDFFARYGRRRLARLLVSQGSPPLEETVESVLHDLEGLAAVLVLDDFHHSAAQPELRHFVRQLLEMLPPPQPPARIIILSCHSPQLYDRREVEIDKKVWELQLGGLDEESSRELASRSGIPRAAQEGAYRATRGHPLSIQLLGGLPAFQDAQRFLQEDVIGSIPANERSLLQLLSVLRRPEDRQTILAMSDDPLAFDALSSLVSRSLVSSSDGKYEVHEMVREGAYGRIPPEARKAEHLRAAARYLKGPGVEGAVEAVYHYCRAGQFERAAQLLLSLGGELIAEGALEDCRALLDMVDPGAPSEAEGLRRLRQDLLAEYGEWDLGFEYLLQCAILAPAAGMKFDIPGRRIRSEKEWQAAVDDHERALEVLDRVGDAAGRCEMLTSLGWVRLMRGEYREAADAYGVIGRFRGKRGCRQAALKAELGAGHLAWLQGNRPGAARLFRKTLGRLKRSEQDIAIGCLNYLSLMATTGRELKAALGHLEVALARCGTGRRRRERAYTLLHMGQIRSRLGDRQGAARSLSSGLSEFRGIGDQHGTIYVLLALSLDSLLSNDGAAAQRWAEEAVRDPALAQMAAVRDYARRLASAPPGEKAVTGPAGDAAGGTKGGVGR